MVTLMKEAIEYFYKEKEGIIAKMNIYSNKKSFEIKINLTIISVIIAFAAFCTKIASDLNFKLGFTSVINILMITLVVLLPFLVVLFRQIQGMKKKFDNLSKDYRTIDEIIKMLHRMKNERSDLLKKGEIKSCVSRYYIPHIEYNAMIKGFLKVS